jgi:hypothetical protein
MEAVKAAPLKSIHVRSWKPQDWVEHFLFGVGQVNDFVNGGRRTLLKSTNLNRVVASEDRFKFPSNKNKSRTKHLKEKSPRRSLNERELVSHD